jgi:Na+/H+-dicarboxylate symporter
MEKSLEKPKKSSSFVLKILLAIILGSVLGFFLTYNTFTIFILRLFITFSDLFSQFLSFFVPIVVLTLSMPSIIDLGHKASKMLMAAVVIAFSSLLLIGVVCMVLGYAFIPTIFSNITIAGAALNHPVYSGFLPVLLKPFFDVVAAIVLAFAFGIAFALIKADGAYKVVKEVESATYFILNKFIIPVLPFYIASIFAKLAATGELMAQMTAFALVIFAIFIISISWTLVLMFVISLVAKRSFLLMLKSYLAPYFVAFGTQSSKATIPVSLVAAEKVGVTKEVREFGVPLFATIHLVGSMVTQVFGALAIYYIFMGTMIDVSLMISYLFILAVILLGAPGIPGGEPVATKPLLSSYLGFPPVVAETMFTLGLANDSFSTATNVTTDNTVLLLLDELYKKWFLRG